MQWHPFQQAGPGSLPPISESLLVQLYDLCPHELCGTISVKVWRGC